MNESVSVCLCVVWAKSAASFFFLRKSVHSLSRFAAAHHTHTHTRTRGAPFVLVVVVVCMKRYFRLKFCWPQQKQIK